MGFLLVIFGFFAIAGGVRDKELQRGNANRATLAVARKMVAYMLAVERRQQDFVPAEEIAGKAVA